MFRSINPYNLEPVGDYAAHTDQEVTVLLEKAQSAFEAWRQTTFAERAGHWRRVAEALRRNEGRYARQMTLEMGKPIVQARAEVAKCAWVCDFYAEHAAKFLSPERIATDARQSWVRYDPLGPVLAIMPWNYPYWQVFRFLAPAVMAGNVGLLKHAPNVFGCAGMIGEIMERAGFPEGVFQNLFIEHDQVEAVIRHPAVSAVTLTGSERAGAAVAAQAGRAIKKTVLELGGSNAFIVLEDADLDRAVEVGVQARMQNSGQSCIAAKRFLLQKGIAEEYLARFQEKMQAFRSGDPLEETVTIGPLARVDLAETLERQVQRSVAAGAELVMGGKRSGAYFEPTLLTGIRPGMPAFDEELFGPVAACLEVEDLDEAIEWSNRSRYGLGATVFTRKVERVLEAAGRFDDGAVFVNELVKSDPRLPFGGAKRSGYGRELGKAGILEFVNVKTVYVG